MPSLRPFFSFYGAKWRAAPHYPPPRYDTVIEPFAGSAGYSLRYPERDVWLLDTDERVVGTWRYLLAASEEEVLGLPDLGPDDRVGDLPLPPGARWLIGWWLNKGTTAPANRPGRWMREPLPGRVETYWGPGVRARLARQLRHVRHWRVELATYERAPAVEATWFIDPPYSGPAGRHYTHGNSRLDYPALAGWCRRRRGQVLVCENAGATWLPFSPHLTAKATAGRGRTRVSHEVLWVNGDAAVDLPPPAPTTLEVP